MTFTIIKSFSEIVSKFDGFILDQFGVMHNGSSCLPGSTECVKQLASMGKKLIILSNTSSPSETAMKKLPKLGFDPNLFVGVVTSGEEASRYIRDTYGNDPQNVKKALWFTWEEPEVPLAFLSKCGHIEPTIHIDEADFVITHGCKVIKGREENENISLGSYMETADFTVVRPLLERCAKRGLPMVCANPDLIVKLPGDVTAHMPGECYHFIEYMNDSNECLRDEISSFFILSLCLHTSLDNMRGLSVSNCQLNEHKSYPLYNAIFTCIHSLLFYHHNRKNCSIVPGNGRIM